MGTKEYDMLIRQQCKASQYFYNFLKHLAPTIWETRTHNWHSLITIKHISPTGFTYHAQPTDAILAKLPHDDKLSSKPQLRKAIDNLRTVLLLPADTEHRKLPKDLTPKSTLIHPTWYAYIKQNELPTHLVIIQNTN
jgi:hypothetical protein